MDLSGEYRLPAERQSVWDALNDPEVLRQIIPGAESVARTSDTEFSAIARVKIGPVNARFRGTVSLSDIDPPNGYTLTGKGEGGSAGFAQGSATIRLVEDGSHTLLTYQVNATVGGKLAQIGQRFIDSAAAKMSTAFFENFNQLMGGSSQATPDSNTSTPSGLSPWIWGPAVALALLGITYIITD
ncbi:MAG: carbon monoxide dehydrogenase subunit G [Parvularculales bacterium]